MGVIYRNGVPYGGATSTYSPSGTTAVNGIAVAQALSELPVPMVFRGSLGTGGTITSLPVDGSAAIGDTYKVITNGTYDGKAAKIGDTFICLTKTSSANTWELIPSGDETDTWRSISVDGTQELGTGTDTGGVNFVGGNNVTLTYASNNITVDVAVPTPAVSGMVLYLNSTDVPS